MELELSLGDSPAPAKGTFTSVLTPTYEGDGEGHELVLELGVGTANKAEQDNQKTPMQPEDVQEEDEAGSHMLPASAETGTVNSEVCRRGFDVNNVPVDGGAAKARSSSTSSLHVDVPVRQADDQDAAEDEENCGVARGARKKLRLSKEQSAFLEDSFKEHSTLTPKQKSDLAKRLNLRPRQVEVWFQNRRARTKLKQTEVDYEYLKRCCETLTQENRRLQREVAELRAYRTTHPIYSHLPGFSTARSVCPSCDIKAAAYSPVVTAVSSPPGVAPSVSTLFARPHLGPFTVHPVLHCQRSATS